MYSIGSRIKEERERLGFSQIDFAGYGSVKRGAQANYEADSRSPDAEYLQGIASRGADIQYIITGVKTLNMKDIERASLEDFYVEFEPLVRLHGEIDTALLRDVIATVHRVVQRYPSIKESTTDDVARAITIFYRNHQKEGTRPDQNDASVLSTMELMN